MNDLVSIVNDKPMTTSLIVAKKFKREHRNVLRDIENLECSQEFRALNFELSSYRSKQGKDFPMYHMTRDGFVFLCMGFTGQEAAKWKEAYIGVFNAMEAEIAKTKQNKAIEWGRARHQTREARKDLTDCIQKFVEYATAQGSKNAAMYYSNITKMEYAALSLISQREKVPSNFRDTLDLMDLSFLMTAEFAAQNAIEYGMLHGMNYKDIYTLAKHKVETFAATVRVPRIGEPKRINPPDLPSKDE